MTPSHPPIISLANFDERKAEITEQLMTVGKQTGFFYISDWDNAGQGPLTQDLIDRCFEVHKRYFLLPESDKLALPPVDWAAQRYFGHNAGSKSAGVQVHEAHWKWWPVHEEAEAAYPPEELVPGFKETSKEMMWAFPSVYDKVLSCFALGLGFEEDFFQKVADVRSTDNHTQFTCNYYWPTEGHEFKPGVARTIPHTDESLITLLLTSPGSTGLELAAGKDGNAVDKTVGMFEVEAWHDCPHIPGCITVNIGDSLQAYSDGVLKSNFHRVRMPTPGEPQGDRASLVAFIWPNDSEIMQGPKKTFPAVPFARFMDAKSKGFATLHERQHELEEHATGLNYCLGIPEVTAAA